MFGGLCTMYNSCSLRDNRFISRCQVDLALHRLYNFDYLFKHHNCPYSCLYVADDFLSENLHLPCSTWILRAVGRVKFAPHIGHSDFAIIPSFCRW